MYGLKPVPFKLTHYGQAGFPAYSCFVRYSVESVEAPGAEPRQAGRGSMVSANIWEAPGRRGEFLPSRRL